MTYNSVLAFTVARSIAGEANQTEIDERLTNSIISNDWILESVHAGAYKTLAFVESLSHLCCLSHWNELSLIQNIFSLIHHIND